MKGCSAAGLINVARMNRQLSKQSHLDAYGLKRGQITEIQVSSTKALPGLSILTRIRKKRASRLATI